MLLENVLLAHLVATLCQQFKVMLLNQWSSSLAIAIIIIGRVVSLLQSREGSGITLPLLDGLCLHHFSELTVDPFVAGALLSGGDDSLAFLDLFNGLLFMNILCFKMSSVFISNLLSFVNDGK